MQTIDSRHTQSHTQSQSHTLKRTRTRTHKHTHTAARSTLLRTQHNGLWEGIRSIGWEKTPWAIWFLCLADRAEDFRQPPKPLDDGQYHFFFFGNILLVQTLASGCL